MSLSSLFTTIFLCTCLFYGTCESYTTIEFLTLNDSIYVPYRTAVSAVASKTKVFFPALLALTATNIVDVYDVVNKNWSTLVIQTLGTTKNFLGTEANGKIYFTTEFGLSNEVDIYDVANDSFTQGTLSSKKQAVSVVHAPSIKCVFFAGGFDGLMFTDTIDIFHYDTNTWTGAKLSFPRFFISGAANGNYVIFAGGQYLQEIRADIDIYNTVTNQWTTAALSVARINAAAVASQSDQRIYFAGGQTAFADLPATPPVYSSLIDVFNVDSTGAIKWSTMTLSSPRTRVAGTSVGPYVFFSAGVLNSAAGLYSNIVDVFNSTDNTFLQYTLPANYVGYLSGAATPSSTFLSPTRPRLNDSAIQVFNVHCADGNPALACDDGNDLNGDGCSSTCEVERCWYCSRPYPSQCVRCCTDWEPLTFPGSGPRLCTSCQGGASKLFLARVLTESPVCDALNLSACSIQPCPALPCLNQSGTVDRLYYLSKPYLQVIFNSLEITSDFTVTSYGNVLMDLRFVPCDNSVNVTYIGTIIESILFDFFFGEGLDLVVDPANCRIVVQKNMTYWQYFSLLALLLPILIVIAILGFYYHSILHQLPEEINWSFMKRLTQPWRWTNGGGYYTREIQRGTDDWARVENLLIGDFESTNNIKPVAIKAVYNEHLIASFISFYKITQTRRKTSADVFFTKGYKNDEQKMWVMERFAHVTRKLLLWDFNEIPILPAIHGTDVLIAEKIAQTGFAALSSLDAGYFGRGIYFTTSILYTIPYCCGKRTPAIIIAYLNLGNIFPVTESHKGEKKLMGAALKSGYNSHFVVTTPEGFVYTPEDLDKGVKICHEIVVPQESQILPAFIVELDKETIKNEFDNWIREIPTYVDELKQYNPTLDRSKEAQPDMPSSPSFLNSFGSQSNIQKKDSRSLFFEGGLDLGIMGSQETQVLRILDGDDEVEYRQMI